jgi:hypothetical protein
MTPTSHRPTWNSKPTCAGASRNGKPHMHPLEQWTVFQPNAEPVASLLSALGWPWVSVTVLSAPRLQSANANSFEEYEHDTDESW